MSGVELLDFQKVWVDNTWEMLRNGSQAVLAQAPTGMGKTVCMGRMIQQIIESDFQRGIAPTDDGATRVVVLVHRQELLLQTLETLCRFDVQPRVLASDSVSDIAFDHIVEGGRRRGENWKLGGRRHKIWVASIPALTARLRSGRVRPPSAQIIFVDECHHIKARTWLSLVNRYREQNALLVGLTATPERTDGSPMLRSDDFPAAPFDSIHFGPSNKELVDIGMLAYPKLFAPQNTQISRDGLKKVGGDFKDRKELTKRSRKITGDAYALWRKHFFEEGAERPVGPALVFCASLEDAAEKAAYWTKRGWRGRCIDGNMDEEERSRIIEGVKNGEVDVLTSCEVLSEGMDIPNVAGAILMRTTASRILYLQQIGRALRRAEGKLYAIILDMTDNTQHFGHPLIPIDWRPQGRRDHDSGRAGAAATVICPNPECAAVNFARVARCTECGRDLPKRFPRGGSGRAKPEVVEGDLEITIKPTPQNEVWAALSAGNIDSEEAAVEMAVQMGLSEAWAMEAWQMSQGVRRLLTR